MATKMRRSLQDLQADYDGGNKKPLENLMRAWAGIKALPYTDQNSFWVLGGYHGEPFRGAGWGTSAYWGGYCNHGNVLFPTWHRVYLLRLEKALQSIKGCEDVMLPFWDECSAESIKNGIPKALTQPTFVIDGVEVPNPLISYTFPRAISDNISTDDGVSADSPNYSKPLDYTTVRYPLSGLVGTPAEEKATKQHNAAWQDPAKALAALNGNIVEWLTMPVTIDGQVVLQTGIGAMYAACLNAPTYTLFSNTTSAQEWNTNQPANAHVTPLEAPHNMVHLAVGGFDNGQGDASIIPGANGDMGENDTAGLDPIFYFHHCYVDRIFWLWQKKHDQTKSLEIEKEYPGTNTVDNQGPTPGVAPNTWLTVDSPLDPFLKEDGKPYTTRDCVDIEALGYSYGPGSFDEEAATRASVAATAGPAPEKALHVTRINKGRISGSFLVSAFATIDGKEHHIGTHAILSRWHVQGCMNCQAHLETRATFPLPASVVAAAARAGTDPQVRAIVRTRQAAHSRALAANPPTQPGLAGALAFKVELR